MGAHHGHDDTAAGHIPLPAASGTERHRPTRAVARRPEGGGQPAAWARRPPGVPAGVPPPTVPLGFLAAAAVGLVGCGVAFWWARAAGISDPTADPVVAATHLGVLATLAMGVLGAVHQFAPVITGRGLRSVRLARGTLACWFAAAWLLPLGVATEQLTVTAVSGALAGVAVVALAVNLAPALAARGKGAPVTGLRYAVGAAVVTGFVGILFVGDRQGRWFALAGHVDLTMGVVGMFGWLGLSYVAVAEKLWPMFFLAHVPGRRRAGRLAVHLVALGTALLAAGLGLEVDAVAGAGALVLAGGLGAHLTSLAAHVRHRRRRADLHLVFVLTSALWLVAGSGLAVAGAAVVGTRPVTGSALVAAAGCAFGGWLLVALVGHAHKVVPFVVWSALRSRGIATGPSGKPLLFADLYDHRGAAATYGATTAGVLGLCLGFAASWSWAIGAGGGMLVVSGLLVAANLSVVPLRLLRGGATAATATSDAGPSAPSPERAATPAAPAGH